MLGTLLVALGAMIRMAVFGLSSGRVAYLTFSPLVLFAAFIAGAPAAVTALVLSALVVHLIFVPLRDGADWFGLAVYLSATGLVIAAAELFLRARAEAAAEKKTAAVKSRLAAIVESSADPIIGNDLEGTITSWNAAATRLFGYDAEQMVGQSIMRLVPSALEAEEAEISARLKAGERIDPYETSRVGKSGNRIDVSLTVSPIYGEEGEVVGASTIIRDVGERKRAEMEVRSGQAALRESVERFRALIEASSDVVYWMSPDWTVMRHLIGHNFIADTEAPSGTWLQTYIHPVDQPQVMAVINDAIRKKSVFELEHRVLRVDGGVGWTHSRAVPILDPSGEITEWVGMASDITDRKQAEAERERLLGEIQAERDRISALIASMQDEVWFADTNKRFTLANPAALKEFGLATDDAVDIEKFAASLEMLRPDGSPQPPEEAPALRALNGETLAKFEEIIRTPVRGELRYRQVNATPVRDNAGQIIGSVTVVRDITERKAAQAELQRTRDQLAEGQRIAHLGSWDYLAATQTTAWSDEQKRIYGLDPSEPSPDYEALLRDHIHPEDATDLDRAFRSAVQNEAPFEHEHRIIRPDGGVRCLYNKAQPHHDERGALQRYVGATLDITERKRAEENLRSQAALLELAHDAIMVRDPEDKVTFWNRGAEATYGWTREEALGRVTHDLLRTRFPKPLAELMAEVKEKGQWDGELIHTRKDGQDIVVASRWAAARNEAGRPAGVLEINREVTERKRAEEEIRRRGMVLEAINRVLQIGLARQSEEEMCQACLSVLEEATMSAISFIDEIGPDGLLHDLAISNPAWDLCKMRDQIGHRKPPGDFRIHGIYGRVVSDGRSLIANDPASHPDRIGLPEGHPPLTSFLGAPLWREGKTVGMIAVGNRKGGYRPEDQEVLETLASSIVEALDRKRAEQALREADQRKDEFLAMLAHELRNPLGPIRNGLDMLRLGVDGARAARVQEMMARQVDQLVRLVDDLLEASRVSRGRIELRTEPVDLAQVVNEAVFASQPLVADLRRQLTVSLPPEPLPLNADPARLAQVVANLLNNAVKFTEAGGRIEISARREDCEAVVSVKDSGVGIPADKLRWIFELFTQIDSGRAHSRSGLGLGLALVRTLVEMHGGRVEARSEGVGRGSEFVVRLPLADLSVAGAPEGAAIETAAPSSARRVLVVDDNRDVADALEMLLKTMDADVRVAYGGRSALEIAAAFRPEVVLMDLGMPEMDGYETAQRLRQLPDGAGILLVALTGWGQDKDLRRTQEAGFDKHLVKPVRADVMQALLAERG